MILGQVMDRLHTSDGDSSNADSDDQSHVHS